jgi:hypothetical protein
VPTQAHITCFAQKPDEAARGISKQPPLASSTLVEELIYPQIDGDWPIILQLLGWRLAHVATDPISSLFDPHHYKAQIRPILNIAIPLMEEVRNYGLSVFARCSIRPEGDDENAAILFSYLHLLDMFDSIVVMMAESVITPTRLPARSMFEALLAIEYILESDTVRRGHAYIYADVRNRMRSLRRADSQSSEGKRFHQLLEKDSLMSGSGSEQFFHSIRAREGLDQLERLLAKPTYAEIVVEDRRMKTAGRRNIPWYGLFGGPGNLQQLAERLNAGATYEMLYRWMSGTSHAQDAVRRLLVEGKYGESGARGLRDPTDILNMIHLTLSFALRASRKVLDRYRPEEVLQNRQWYRREIKPNWDKLRKIQIVQTTPPSANVV